jgi:hypothetical protein
MQARECHWLPCGIARLRSDEGLVRRDGFDCSSLRFCLFSRGWRLNRPSDGFWEDGTWGIGLGGRDYFLRF